ncbi:hypothetical protein [Streptomyces sp. NBC_01285]|uniref:hypothetical protein n=1 Tax=Streptomyces sp. NBC_01285 TaxID=2903813 RepID=UPI00224E7D9F|nr:hypothetical protein [Streptomyces sp. NBC_01285]MCX4774487.1 hypothetical protein [Streptomyces sp. NBC_01285]
MIHLSFYLPESGSAWRKTWDAAKQGDPAAATEMDLRYKYFGANFELAVDDTEVVSRTRFVTLVDLALSLSGAAKRISLGEDAAFGFTESDEVIQLCQDGDLIAVSSSKRPVQAFVGREELVREILIFLREAHSRLITEIPGLSANPVIQRIHPEWAACLGRSEE